MGLPYIKLEIGLGPRIRDMEAFWYKTEIKIIYFVPFCLIVFDLMVYHDPKFLILKTKRRPHFFLRLEADFFYPMLSRKAFATNSLK